MKIEQINSCKFKITLSCTEILEMNSDVYPAHTAKLIQTLLKTLEDEHCFSIFNRKILLEMIPSVKDGCHIFLTALYSEQNDNERGSDILIVSLSRWETVAHALELLEINIQEYCALYLLDEVYYLVIRSVEATHLNLQTRLSDLGDCVKNPKMFESVLLEYASLIAEGKTLQAFYKKSIFF
ncbi:MAG: hypothetical protein J6A61_02870 [Clostridia bacterium]|nr:hypothetical protein [Clostridia bacterium]